jgi:hypothetical protein
MKALLMGFLRAMVLLGGLIGGFAEGAMADAKPSQRSWPEEKCFRYQRDWREALRRYGPSGVGAEFLAANEAFIRSGCQSADKICPHNPRERELVDILAIRVVNEGMSTTFLPFNCPNP